MSLFLNRNWLYQKCIVEKLPDYMVAKFAKCSETTIARKRCDFGLYRNKPLKYNGKNIFYQPSVLLNADETRKAAIAGFNDGDGHIGISRVKKRRSSNWSYSLHIVFSQSRADKMKILYSIQKYYGGFIYIYPRTKKHSRFGQLRIGTWQSIKLIDDCYQYMEVRKKQANIAKKFIEIKKNKSEGKNQVSQKFIDAQEKCKQEISWFNREGTYESRKYTKLKYEKKQMELGI